MTPVLPYDVQRGWREATPVRRALVRALPLLVVFWAVLPELGSHTAAVNDLSAVLGGVVFYAAARVLRPHQGREVERILRHGLASLAMSCATNFFVIVAFALAKPDPTTGLPVLIATLGLVLTVPWGIVACAVRAVREARQPRQPLVWPSPVTT